MRSGDFWGHKTVTRSDLPSDTAGFWGRVGTPTKKQQHSDTAASSDFFFFRWQIMWASLSANPIDSMTVPWCFYPPWKQTFIPCSPYNSAAPSWSQCMVCRSFGGLRPIPEEVVWGGLCFGGTSALWLTCLPATLVAQPASLVRK